MILKIIWFKVILFFNIFYFLRLNRTTSFLALLFFVALIVISRNVIKNYYTFRQYFHRHCCPKDLTTRKGYSNVRSLKRFLSNFAMDLSRFLISAVEMCRQLVRPVSLTCRLRSNISSRHLLISMCTSSTYFSVNLAPIRFVMWFLFIPRYLIFEIGVALIQSFF
jgi:hypothetical protein